jgi:EAL domain-containing protein (putative c-di-GMP-specific phosphodiesterase class I)
MLCNAVFNIAIGVMSQNKIASLSEFTVAAEAMPPLQRKFGEKDLEDALVNFYLRVEYQPKVPFQLSRTASFGVEALCRIHHPDFGIVAPDDFIALAESTGRIGRLTDQVVTRALFDWRKWFDHGLTLKLALNISPELLANGDWAERFLAQSAEYGVDPEYVTLEITESSPRISSEAALDVLHRLKLKGYTLAIDDFGTGFSSLSNLYKLPFSELKIDKSFTRDFRQNPAARALVESTVEMAKRLDIRVTVEGIESDSTFSELRLLGCDEAQGHVIGKSLAAEDIPDFFTAWSSDWETARTAPKMAMIQALLQEVMADSAPDATLVLAVSKTGHDGGRRDAAAFAAIRKIPALALEGATVAALGECHTAIARLAGNPGQARVRKQLLELQRLLEDELLVSETIELGIGERRFRLLPLRAALIGRPSRARDVEISIDCRWFSRGERNLYLFSDGEQWFVEDLGSTNGSWIGNERLVPGKPVALGFGETRVDVGRTPAGPAPVTVHLHHAPTAPNVVQVTVSALPEAQRDTLARAQWPSREEDLTRTWLVFRDGLSMGAAPGCGLPITGSHLLMAADIRFQNGFWISPRTGAGLTINDVAFEAPVPIPSGGRIRLADVPIRIEQPVMRTADSAISEQSMARTGTDGET